MDDTVDASKASIAKIEVIIHGVTHIFDDNEYPEPVYVTYGQGCQWFKAPVTTSRAPIWDIVQEFSIGNVHVPVRVQLHRERVSIGREQVIGRLKIPLESAASSKERSIRHTKPFPPIRGTTKFGGYLAYQCYVTEYRPAGNRVIEYMERKLWTSFDAIWNGDLPTRIPYKLQRAVCLRCRRRNSQADDDDLVSMKRDERFASFHDPSVSISFASLPNTERLRRTHSASFRASDSTPVPTATRVLKERRKSRTPCVFPMILSVEPRSGSMLGGTRIAIRGTNLGLDAQDLTGVYICGSNCLSSLEYESDQLLYCTTKAWRACTGQVTLLTASGGRSQGNVKFSFVDKKSRDSKKSSSGVSLKAPDIQHRRERSANLFVTVDSASDSTEWSSRNNLSEPSSPNVFARSTASFKAAEMLEKQCFMVLRTVEESTQTNESFLETDNTDKTEQSVTDESSSACDSTLLDMTKYIQNLEQKVVELKVQNADLKMQLDDLTTQ